MGTCGCGDFQGDFKFSGPGDTTYVLSVYGSCHYCDTPAGIILYAMTPDDCRDWDVDAIPEINIQDIGTLVGVVNPDVYVKKLLKLGIDLEGCEPDINLAFREAVYDEQIENNKVLG